MIARLVLLTDRSQLRLGRSLVQTVQECADAGLEAVIVREHDLPKAARSALVSRLARIDGLTVLSSRTWNPAAHGAHLAADQSPRRDPRPWGKSCHSVADVRRAARAGAKWASLSPYGVSQSKPGHGPALPAQAYAGHDIPVWALGGVDVSNAADALAAGAYGVAVMGAVMRAESPRDVVAGLVKATR